MNSRRWERVKQVYSAALRVEPGGRDRFVREACGGDESLFEEIRSLLAQEGKPEDVLESPPLEVAARALADEAAPAPPEDLSGRTLSHYHLEEKIGQGGMGVVYRAFDTFLERTVALKILPPVFASDQDRMRRFLREAKAASALNHPNVATIHEVGEAEGVHFIAMEYVSGQTLSEYSDKRRLEPGRIVDIGIQMAEALDEAHAKGIIHRDLKPANVMVTARGQVKVLDFGLAKLARPEREPGDSSIRSITESGLVLGTVPYMSPEQVLGHQVDRRTDIFSLGTVLYELATGHAAFAGGTTTEVMDRILHGQPEEIARFNHKAPGEFERIVRKCLEKDRELRYQHASELCADLKRLKRDTELGKPAAQISKPKRSAYLLSGAALLLIAAIAAAGIWFLQSRRHDPEAPLVPVPVTASRGFVTGSEISPDGKQVAFAWYDETQLAMRGIPFLHIYVKQIGSDTARQLTDGQHRDLSPVWSPDGLSIAFVREWTPFPGKAAVMLIQANAGRERHVADLQDIARDAWHHLSWHPSGKWLAIAGTDTPGEPPALYLLSLETGEKRRLTSPVRGMGDLGLQVGGDANPAFSPDGRKLAFSRWFASDAVSEIFVANLSARLEVEGEPKQLTFGDRMADGPAWMPDGKHLIFAFGSKAHHCGLWRVSVSGSDPPSPLPFLGASSALDPSISLENHRLIYTVLSSDFNIWSSRIAAGRETPPEPSRLIPSTKTQEMPRYSPDGKELLYVSYASGSSEIWISNSDGSNPLQLTRFGGPMPNYPRWSPDGKHITFSMASRAQVQIFLIPARGGQARQLTHSPGHKGAPSYSRDGRWIYFRWIRRNDDQIWKKPVEGGDPVQVTRFGGYLPQESMDGKYLFYLKSINMVRSSVWMLPLEGGEERRVLDDVLLGNFDVKEHGIYYVGGPTKVESRLLYYNLSAGKTRVLQPIEGRFALGFTVSRDERWFLLTKGWWRESNLMLVENFH
jgi:eukaryotic-like serine/threonine-protein kinase